MTQGLTTIDRLPPSVEAHGYRVEWARTAADVAAVTRLRFEVFNLELGEGLAASYASGHDRDRFDDVCDHLLIRDLKSGRVIGTYRVQTAERASEALGFYSRTLFHVADLPREVLKSSVEVGRACVAQDFRNRRVLLLLWRGLASYLTWHHQRYLFGCCSIPTTDPAQAWACAMALESSEAWHPEWRVRGTVAVPEHHSDLTTVSAPSIPPLFQTYLRFGAQVCGGPIIDKSFGTTDFFVLLDLTRLSPEAVALFFAPRS